MLLYVLLTIQSFLHTMKNLCLLFLLTLPLTLCAKIWIVDSNPGSASKDFVNLQAAHDGASAGDTLYLIGSGVSYISSKVTINKRLVIIGPGYFLENPDTQVSLLSATLDKSTNPCEEGLVFAAGSEGSVLMGVTMIGQIRISTSNILIKRNTFRWRLCGSSLAAYIRVQGSFITITQNYMQPPETGFGPSILVDPGFSNISIRNNHLSTHSSSTYSVISSGSGLEISNNVIQRTLNVSNAFIQNNLFYSAVNPILAPGSVIRNNISISSIPFAATNGNLVNVPLATIVDGTGSTDVQWKLKEGSPAIGTGYEGTDMGMFGGDEPYVLSGIPPIPTIYQLNAPTTGEKNTGLPITIKAKSNN